MIRNEAQKRGWIFDAILQIGQIEAGMEHSDEQICNIYHDMSENNGDLDEITKLTEELADNRELLEIDYQDRVVLQNMVFDAIPDSNKHYWCRLKHAATAFAKAAENYHASKLHPEFEQHLVRAGQRLAIVCSRAFGMEVMDCLRCVSDSLSGQEQPEYQVADLSITPKEEKIDSTNWQ